MEEETRDRGGECQWRRGESFSDSAHAGRSADENLLDQPATESAGAEAESEGVARAAGVSDEEENDDTGSRDVEVIKNN